MIIIEFSFKGTNLSYFILTKQKFNKFLLLFKPLKILDNFLII